MLCEVDSELGKMIVENASPVDEKVRSSTAVYEGWQGDVKRAVANGGKAARHTIFAPSDIGNDDLTCVTFMSWRTTDCGRDV